MSIRLGGFRQHQCCFVVGEQPIEQSGCRRDKGRGLSFTDDARAAQREGVAPLVQYGRPAGQYVFDPVRFKPVADENDEAVPRLEHQEGRSIMPA